VVAADARGAWSAPVPITAVNSTANDQAPAISPNGLVLYFASNRDGNNEIYVSTRECRVCAWSDPVALGEPINTPAIDGGPFLSADGRLLFFNSNRGGNGDLYVARRLPGPGHQWDTPIRLGPGVNTQVAENNAHYIQQPHDGYLDGEQDGVLYFGRAGEVYVVGLTRDIEVIGTAVPVTELNDPLFFDAAPTLSASGREIIFDSARPGSQPPEAPAPFFDLWMSTRRTIHDRWSPPVNLGPVVNGEGEDFTPALSFDGHTLVFTSRRDSNLGGWDLWMSTR
jgi:hypothetical protein